MTPTRGGSGRQCRRAARCLEPAEVEEVEAAWRQEVAARVAALDAGEVETIP
jgi:hypothetical protein